MYISDTERELCQVPLILAQPSQNQVGVASFERCIPAINTLPRAYSRGGGLGNIMIFLLHELGVNVLKTS